MDHSLLVGWGVSGVRAWLVGTSAVRGGEGEFGGWGDGVAGAVVGPGGED
ncbi:MAG: hypothetical protein ACLQER_05145 [Streptosporangiaceae bacterium]